MRPSWFARRGETAWVELLSAAGCVGWGLYVATAAEPLALVPAYDVLSRYIPDRAWVMLALLCAALQAGSLCANRALWRFGSAFMGLIWWKLLTFSLINSGESAPGAAVYCVIALFNTPTIVLLRPRGRRAPR